MTRTSSSRCRSPLRRSSTTPRLASCRNTCWNPPPPDEFANAPFNINPVGTGPYKFDHLLVDAGQITGVVLTVNDHYYGRSHTCSKSYSDTIPTPRLHSRLSRKGRYSGVSESDTRMCCHNALADPDLSVYTSQVPQISWSCST